MSGEVLYVTKHNGWCPQSFDNQLAQNIQVALTLQREKTGLKMLKLVTCNNSNSGNA